MKRIILVGDGMADAPIAELENKTPLEYAHTPNMDRIASSGRIGRARTVPEGMPPGSDVANMSLMGYDPARYFTGRAPIEAASLGLSLSSNQTAFRCNLVTIENGTMADYSAGHIENEDAEMIINELQQKLNGDTVAFYPGVSYRHLLVIDDFPDNLQCTPPHDISGQMVKQHLPHGPGQEIVLRLSEAAHAILESSEVNARRIREGKKPVTDIWLWGQGKALQFPTLHQRYGLNGSVISAVDLVRGLGKLAGLTVCHVQGATGYLGTNYAGKVEAARQALKEQEFVYLHVEAPDETSHEGSLKKKLQAIEEFDKHVVGEMLPVLTKYENCRILVLPDHATLLSTRTHDRAPIPYVVTGHNISPDINALYCEATALPLTPIPAVKLFDTFIRGNFD
ncbi:MAG: cofactor-independent phosphoglycerate mutase [Chitinivibrionales bacterium]